MEACLGAVPDAAFEARLAAVPDLGLVARLAEVPDLGLDARLAEVALPLALFVRATCFFNGGSSAA